MIDYAAQRSDWLSDALAVLRQRHHETKVRVLVLERALSGEWWSTTQRVNRLEESYRVTSAMYATPRRLSGLDRAEARTLVMATASQLGKTTLSTTQVEDVVDLAEHMDSDLALAENVIRTGQAAWWYSLRMPPNRWRRRMSIRVIWA